MCIMNITMIMLTFLNMYNMFLFVRPLVAHLHFLYTLTFLLIMHRQLQVLKPLVCYDSGHAIGAEHESILFESSKAAMFLCCLHKESFVYGPDWFQVQIIQQFPICSPRACVWMTTAAVFPALSSWTTCATDPPDAQICIFGSMKWHQFAFAPWERSANLFPPLLEEMIDSQRLKIISPFGLEKYFLR